MLSNLTRRELLGRTSAILSGAYLAGSSLTRAAAAPAGPVSVARCKTYDPSELLPIMRTMFDQLGGLGRLVKGKTVAIKINLTCAPSYRLGYLPLETTHYTHPNPLPPPLPLLPHPAPATTRPLPAPL